MTKWYLQIDPVFWLSDLYQEQNNTITLVKEFCADIVKHRKDRNQNIEIKSNDAKSDDGNIEMSIVDRFLASKVMSDDSLWQETMTIFTSVGFSKICYLSLSIYLYISISIL